MKKTHYLKAWPIYYQPVKREEKTLEIRLDDRIYEVGDDIVLQEFEPETKTYTGDETRILITHCLRDQPFVPKGYVAMSIKKI